jgi:Ca2+-binding EF-hand superfamily protein
MNTLRLNATLVGSLLAVSFSALSLAGESGEHAGAHERPTRAAMAGHFFEKLDENKDGKVTRQEAEAAGRTLFAKLDQNGDGELTQSEAEAGALTIRQEQLAARFKKLDTNADGHLAPGESQLPPKFFERLDTNKDHVVSLAEFQAMPDFRADHREFQFERSDLNHDGKVTRAEAATANKLRFDAADANHDGKITREEFDARLAKLHEQSAKAHSAKAQPEKPAG